MFTLFDYHYASVSVTMVEQLSYCRN